MQPDFIIPRNKIKDSKAILEDLMKSEQGTDPKKETTESPKDHAPEKPDKPDQPLPKEEPDHSAENHQSSEGKKPEEQHPAKKEHKSE